MNGLMPAVEHGVSPSGLVSAPVTVAAGTEQSLPPGTDSDLTIDGGTLRLQGGEYVFCSVTTNNGSEVVAAASSTLLIVDWFDVLPNSVAAHRHASSRQALAESLQDARPYRSGSFCSSQGSELRSTV